MTEPSKQKTTNAVRGIRPDCFATEYKKIKDVGFWRFALLPAMVLSSVFCR